MAQNSLKSPARRDSTATTTDRVARARFWRRASSASSPKASRSAPPFELLHVNKVNAPMLASPAMAGGTWYFRTHEHLMAVGK